MTVLRPAIVLALLLLVGCGAHLRPRPERVDFGPVWIGQTASLPTPVRWRNESKRPRTVNGATIAGDHAFAFVGAPPSGTIAPGDSGAPAVVSFAPLTVGEVRATVQATGVKAEPLMVLGTGAAQRRRGLLELTADGMTLGKPLDLGVVELNRVGLGGVYLANRGRAPMRLNVRLVSGRALRVLGPAFPLVLEPGRRVRVNLEFSPGALGRHYDALEVESDDGVHFAGTAITGSTPGR